MRIILFFYAVMLIILPFSLNSFATPKSSLSVREFLLNPPKVNILFHKHKTNIPIAQIDKAIEEGDLDEDEVYADFGYFGTLDDVLKDFQKSAQCDDLCKLLTDEEKAALYTYTMYFFSPVNLVLRGKNDLDKEKISPLVNGVSSALKKLPPYSGLVIRGVSMGPYLKAYVPGKVVVEKSFTSTSTHSDLIEFFNFPVVMKIKSKTGRLIRSFSAAPGEEEVLFDKETRFKVISKKLLINDL